MSWANMDHGDDSGAGHYPIAQITYVKDSHMIEANNNAKYDTIDTAHFYAELMGHCISVIRDRSSILADRLSAIEVARKLILDMADIPQSDFDKV